MRSWFMTKKMVIEPPIYQQQQSYLRILYSQTITMWTIADSNRSPHPCHGCALPDELMAPISDIITTSAHDSIRPSHYWRSQLAPRWSRSRRCGHVPWFSHRNHSLHSSWFVSDLSDRHTQERLQVLRRWFWACWWRNNVIVGAKA